ncbi:MAG: Ig-like domain-containing protein [Candidatus Eremiobacterota bacterium]
MQDKLSLTLLFITIFAIIVFIISSGCGGENGITQPPSLTPLASDKIAYITLNVKWPERDIPGSFVISSKDNKNELVASMTKDTRRIEVRIFEDKSTPEGDPIGTEPIGIGTIREPDTTATIPVHIKNNPDAPNTSDVLPVVPVKIWVGAFPDRDGYSLVNPITETLKDYTVTVGNNAINLQLGDYKLTVLASPQNITLPYYFNKSNNISGKIARSTPTPVIIPGKTGNIMIVHSDDDYPYPPDDYPYPPDDTPVPEETPGTDIVAQLMITYPADANGVVPEPKPVAYKPVNFQLQGEGSLSSTWGTTDPNGYCVVSFIPTLEGTDTITANFYPDPNDPNTVYTESCTVNIIRNNNEETPTPIPTVTQYFLVLGANPYSFDMIPEFTSDYFDIPVNTATITATLTKILPNDPAQTHIPVDGAEISFSSNAGNITPTGVTQNGTCQVGFSCSYCTYSGITITARTNPEPSAPAISINSICRIELNPRRLIREPFNKEGWSAYGINLWHINSSYSDLNFSFNGPSNENPVYYYDPQNFDAYLFEPGAKNTSSCAYMYCNPDKWRSASLYYTWPDSVLPYAPLEARFYVKTGDESLTHKSDDPNDPNSYEHYRGTVSFNGVNIKLKDDNKIMIIDPNGHDTILTNYNPGEWTYMKIINIPETYYRRIVYYWINGSLYTYEYPLGGNYRDFHLNSTGGSIWYDEVEMYDLSRYQKKSARKTIKQ